MSPFDLHGPDFLVFYLILSAIVLFALYIFGRASEPGGAIKVDLSDPYLIAYLRGAGSELLRVATVSLIHRGLLKISGTSLLAASEHAADGVRIPLEKELLLHFAKAGEAASVFSESRFSSSAQGYAEYLERYGLLPDHLVKADRWRRLGLTLAILWGFASIKIIVALSGGHTNVGFLIFFAGAATFAAYRMNNPRLTRRGKDMLEDLCLLLAGLRERAFVFGQRSQDITQVSLPAAPQGLDANEVTLLAAAFGVMAIPVSIFPYARTLYGQSAPSLSSSLGNSPGASTYPYGSGDIYGSTTGDGGSGSSSSCGSSGGDGGGSSCGGGGGGGGGCGGCGS